MVRARGSPALREKCNRRVESALDASTPGDASQDTTNRNKSKYPGSLARTETTTRCGWYSTTCTVLVRKLRSTARRLHGHAIRKQKRTARLKTIRQFISLSIALSS